MIRSFMVKLFGITCLVVGLLSSRASADVVHWGSKTLNTAKVAHIYGIFDANLYYQFKGEVGATTSIPGDRLILISSPGGDTSVGEAMIDMLQSERQQGVKMVCVVTGDAHSMAFNFLSFCDVRIAAPDSHFVVHKVAIGGFPDGRITAKRLREIADEVERYDLTWSLVNASAMHLTIEKYNHWADEERNWTSEELLKLKYLDAIGFVSR